MYLDFKDNSYLKFTEENGRDFLKEVSDNSNKEEWRVIQMEDITFITIDDAATALQNSINLKDLEVYADTSENLALYCRFEDDFGGRYFFPIGETAYRSICERAGLSGPAILEVANEDTVYFLNTSFHRDAVENKSAYVYVSCDKVRAMHSTQYVSLNMGQIFDQGDMTLHGLFDDVRFQQGYLDHKYAKASYEVKDDILLANYADLLKVDHNKLKGTVSIITSNVAVAGVTIAYGLMVEDQEIMLGNAEKMVHKGKSCTIDNFDAKLNNIFASYQAAYANLKVLENVIIEHPNSCLVNAMGRLDINKKLVTEFVEDRKFHKGMGPISALSLYIDACGILEMAKNRKFSMDTIIRMTDRIASMTRPDFLKSYDYIAYDSEIKAVSADTPL